MTDHISPDRKLEIVREYWRVRMSHGAVAALEKVCVDYSLSEAAIDKLVAEFPNESPDEH